MYSPWHECVKREGVAAQARQAWQGIVDVLREAGGLPEHIVRMTWYVTDKREYLAAGREVGLAFREIVGAYDAAATSFWAFYVLKSRTATAQSIRAAAHTRSRRSHCPSSTKSCPRPDKVRPLHC